MSNTTKGYVFRKLNKKQLIEDLKKINGLEVIDYKFDNIKGNLLKGNNSVVNEFNFIGGFLHVRYKGMAWQLLVTILHDSYDCYDELNHCFDFDNVKKKFRKNQNFKNSVSFMLPYNKYSEKFMNVILSGFSGVLMVDEYSEHIYYVPKVN